MEEVIAEIAALMGLDSYDVARREGTLLFGNHVVDDLTDLRPERTHRVILQLQPIKTHGAPEELLTEPPPSVSLQ